MFYIVLHVLDLELDVFFLILFPNAKFQFVVPFVLEYLVVKHMLLCSTTFLSFFFPFCSSTSSWTNDFVASETFVAATFNFC